MLVDSQAEEALRMTARCKPAIELTNTASLTPEACCVRPQPLLSETLSEGDRHRQKRANVQAGQLQQKMSTLMGRPLGEAELRTIFPSFSAQMPGSAFSGEDPSGSRVVCTIFPCFSAQMPGSAQVRAFCSTDTHAG